MNIIKIYGVKFSSEKSKIIKNLETVVVRSNNKVMPTTATVAYSVATWTARGHDIEMVFNHFIWPQWSLLKFSLEVRI